MKKSQRIALKTIIMLVSLITILVPWQYTFQSEGISQVVRPAGHHLIFTPPSPEYDHPRSGVKLDFELYLIQLFGIIIVFGGAYLLLKE